MATVSTAARLGALVLALACGRARERAALEGPAAWSAPWLAAQRAAYLDDPAARRAALEASLTNPANTYSRHRLGSYGVPNLGWDLLPVWNPRSRPLADADVVALAGGTPPAAPAAPLWDGARPTDEAGWIALGRRVFFSYPLRPEFAIEHLLGGAGAAGGTAPDRVARAAAAGIERAADGTFPGLVVFRDAVGRTRVGITCALCHAAHRDEVLVEGTARRRFDLGALRLAYYRDTGAPLAPTLAARMASWGPGRADVTEDEDEDPVAIPELWALRARRFLTQAGTIRHVGPAALAIRQETQLLHAGGERTRPPRELAWALAMYLYDLAPPPPRPAQGGAARARGQALFAEHCADCHRDDGFGGDAIPAARIGTDRALADGTARGTGRYRTPALLDVAQTAPYLHDGSVATLDELLAPERLAPGYRGGRLGPGPVPGHAFGTGLAPPERAALRAYLETL